jgi:hypothetical protein
MSDRSEMHRKMRGRNIALLLILLSLVILIAVATYVKMKGL